MSEWPFDQAPNVAAITTRQVIEDGFPILEVVHYGDDDSWAFVCGTSNATADGRVIGMDEALKIDSTLATIADLPPGWYAHRRAVGEPWTKERNPDENGYDLEAVEQVDARDHPFLRNPIPDDAARYGVKVGDVVKLIFRYRDAIEKNGQTFSAEHMWVRVTETGDAFVVGRLDSTPQFTTVLKSDDEVHFHPKHIIRFWSHDTSAA